MQTIETTTLIGDDHFLHIRLPDTISVGEAHVVVVIEEKQKMREKSSASSNRILGLHKGQIWVSKDFDEPLPDSFWTGEE
ncbi:hypothetical protein WDW89_06965 [Deltaproteobacteria bacterium TL4]